VLLTDPTRLSRAQVAVAAAEVDALLVTPGPALRYLTGYEAIPLERLTCLVIPADGEPSIVVPTLERPAAEASPLTGLPVRIADWGETDDPYAQVASLLPAAATVAVDDAMRAAAVLRLRTAIGGAQRLAGPILDQLRQIKSSAEVAALAEAGGAIDTVHAQVGDWLRAGRTEREVGRDIAAAILDAGHATVDFVIVAGGPNGASPHHEVSDRVLQPGDAVVVDIGGTMPSGYCSDSTRVYHLGEPTREYRMAYDALQAAQAAGVAAVAPGVTAEAVDAACRDRLADAGLAEAFIHRTGHGIGMETHEEPYIVAGNSTALQPGMAFSVEPGFYLPGRHGARIEDIVVCTADGGTALNRRPTELAVLEP
jgi:Xaa-Pro aminopeptidase